MSQSQCLKISGRNNPPGTKGYYFDSHKGKWRARIYHKRKRISLGFYDHEHEAAEAYKRAFNYLFKEKLPNVASFHVDGGIRA